MKKAIRSFKAFDNQAVTGTNVYTSHVSNIAFIDKLSYHLFNKSGTASGTFQGQGSNDGVNWFDVGAAITLTTGTFSGGATSAVATYADLAIAQFRMKYTNSANSGNLDATVSGKG